jgi:hypothetical protein
VVIAEAVAKAVWSHSNDGSVTMMIMIARVMLAAVDMSWRDKRGGRTHAYVYTCAHTHKETQTDRQTQTPTQPQTQTHA